MQRLLALAGIVGVGVALGIGELLAGLSGAAPSPLDAVGQQLVVRLPGGVVGFAIETFGTANRAVLATASVAVALAVGAGVGAATRTSMMPAGVAFLAAAALAYPASLAQPEARSPAVALLLGVAVIGGLWVFGALRRRLLGQVGVEHAAGVGEDVTSGTSVRDPTRRSFVGLAAGALGLAAVGAGVGRSVGGQAFGPVATPDAPALAVASRPLPAPTPSADLAPQVAGLSPVFTPNDAFYRIDTAIAVPRVDPATWTLRIRGLVERELVLDYDDLLARELREVDATISCVSNTVGGDLVGNARWLGVDLRSLLDEAGIGQGAEQVVGRSVDGWTGGFPLEAALDGRGAIVAVGMNGEPLPFRHGFPARLVVPGLYGYVSATKWLEELELTTWDGFDGYWVPRGWSKRGPVKTSSRIDVPGAGDQVPAGEVVIAGVAWAPTRGIGQVEVRVDDRDWVVAELSEPLSDETWVQWRLAVDLGAGSHEITVRATDGVGDRQLEQPRPPAPDGAEGWHAVSLQVG